LVRNPSFLKCIIRSNPKINGMYKNRRLNKIFGNCFFASFSKFSHFKLFSLIGPKSINPEANSTNLFAYKYLNVNKIIEKIVDKIAINPILCKTLKLISELDA